MLREDVVEDPSHFDRGALVEVIKDGWGYRNELPGIPQRTFRNAVDLTLAGEGS